MIVGTVKKSAETISWEWFFRKVFQPSSARVPEKLGYALIGVREAQLTEGAERESADDTAQVSPESDRGESRSGYQTSAPPKGGAFCLPEAWVALLDLSGVSDKSLGGCAISSSSVWLCASSTDLGLFGSFRNGHFPVE